MYQKNEEFRAAMNKDNKRSALDDIIGIIKDCADPRFIKKISFDISEDRISLFIVLGAITDDPKYSEKIVGDQEEKPKYLDITI